MILKSARERGRAAFIPFIVAGHPSIEATERAVDALVEAGADLLELGVPFSDPMADGPTIQAASESAARLLPSMEDVMKLAARLHSRHPALPIVLFTYFNPILKMGVQRFAAGARQAGVSAVLVVDLPPEESADYRAALRASGIGTVYLASPTTSAERIRLVSDASTAFVYYVSRMGVTGARSELSSTLRDEMAQLRSRTSKPIAVGFGISTPEQARAVAELGDAVVVGSAFVQRMSEARDLNTLEKSVRELAASLVEALRSPLS